MTDSSFLSQVRLGALGPRRLLIASERLLWHLGFDDVRNIDGPGDEGGDLLAHRLGSRWVFQSKWTSGLTIDDRAVRQVDAAKAFYGADRSVVVTNAHIGRSASAHARRLATVGVRVDFWDGDALVKFGDQVAPTLIPAQYELRPYQVAAIEAVEQGLRQRGHALLVMATGLGKTVVAGEVVRGRLRDGDASVLIVAHTTELIAQLERALWKHLPKTVPTALLSGTERPRDFSGVICATVQSALAAVEAGWTPNFVVVDEAHHVSEDGQLQQLLDQLAAVPKLGVTATPWRGDGYDIGQRFGDPAYVIGIVDGMAGGYLAEVDYRLFVDQIDWSVVASASEHGLSIRDLNARLFLPQRDEEVADQLRVAWAETADPRAIVFCRTIEHAEEFAGLLRSSGWRRATAISNRSAKRERAILMSEFRDGRIPVMVAVDIFNEGVDVPDVNILCFLRVTHSRRIFVQQLGRGLRLRPGKSAVRVLDFVSDVRRVAAALDIQRSLEGRQAGLIERLTLPASRFTFSEPSIGSLLQEWIKDAAALEDADEEVRLQFPEGLSVP